MSSLRIAVRAYPTLLKVGFAEAIAYRAETVVWMLSNTMPLVNLALWSAVARGGPIGGFGQKALTAYFLSALMIRQLTTSWALWEMDRDIRMGTISIRLLRPLHPLVAYSAENLSGLPIRAIFAVPVAIAGLAFAGTDHLASAPLSWALLPVIIFGAWLINFFSNTIMGSLNFFLERSLAVFQLWLGAYFVLSGYLFPLDFLAARAPWAVHAIRLLPFYAMAGFPVEVLLGKCTGPALVRGLAIEWTYVLVLGAGSLTLWRAGIRRYNAYGA